jgi:hypothetical protein
MRRDDTSVILRPSGRCGAGLEESASWIVLIPRLRILGENERWRGVTAELAYREATHIVVGWPAQTRDRLAQRVRDLEQSLELGFFAGFPFKVDVAHVGTVDWDPHEVHGSDE